jgi:hypothetical protein
MTYFKICNVNGSLAHIALAFSIRYVNVLSPDTIPDVLRNLSTTAFLFIFHENSMLKELTCHERRMSVLTRFPLNDYCKRARLGRFFRINLPM